MISYKMKKNGFLKYNAKNKCNLLQKIIYDLT